MTAKSPLSIELARLHRAVIQQAIDSQEELAKVAQRKPRIRSSRKSTGPTAKEIGIKNRQSVLDAIKSHGPVSGSGIRKITGLTIHNANYYANSLADQGMVKHTPHANKVIWEVV
ncbi:MAG TPA: FaeA/PapI family transcriptional regulator [Rhodocyclaceae bacterium]|nr:FaeA/PapI family transcriptional regulator [Rhodocyclaceae bacterium]